MRRFYAAAFCPATLRMAYAPASLAVILDRS
jgi:hypothetical protein